MQLNPDKFFLIAGAIMGALGVAIGAFGAHSLRPMLLETNRMDVFEKASRYQFYHALALLLVGILIQSGSYRWINYSGHFFLWGTIIFSGSLYILCLTGIGKFGAITPIGGVLMIAGWCALAYGLYKG